ncbi:MAG: hypothetical protein BAJATHORv1_40365 [Candidatus Thorarchaeota archaeon]|nr:MAG: hypothetical protein BAJATHORv1_40365 [Candidatus Thorarchaeota archaeon]
MWIFIWQILSSYDTAFDSQSSRECIPFFLASSITGKKVIPIELSHSSECINWV